VSFDQSAQDINPFSTADTTFDVPPAGAKSFRITSAYVPTGKEAVITIVTSAISDTSPAFVSIKQGTLTAPSPSDNWFTLFPNKAKIYRYSGEGNAPELFATIVNPSTKNSYRVKITARIYDAGSSTGGDIDNDGVDDDLDLCPETTSKEANENGCDFAQLVPEHTYPSESASIPPSPLTFVWNPVSHPEGKSVEYCVVLKTRNNLADPADDEVQYDTCDPTRPEHKFFASTSHTIPDNKMQWFEY